MSDQLASVQDEIFSAVIGAFIGAVSVLMLMAGNFAEGYKSGEQDTYVKMKTDAVVHGKAEWVIGLDGEITFR